MNKSDQKDKTHDACYVLLVQPATLLTCASWVPALQFNRTKGARVPVKQEHLVRVGSCKAGRL
jgi:hypothetical protein